MNPLASRVASAVSRAELAHRHGRLTAFNGLVIEASGPDAHLGELCELVPAQGRDPVQAEVVGFRDHRVLLMPYGNVQGISADSLVRATGRSLPVNATGAIGAICCEMGFTPQTAAGLGVMARAIGLVGHVLEEARNPMGMALWLRTEEEASAHIRGKLRDPAA